MGTFPGELSTGTRGIVTKAVSWAGSELRAHADGLHSGSRCPCRAWTLKGHFRCDADNLDSLWWRDTAHTAGETMRRPGGRRRVHRSPVVAGGVGGVRQARIHRHPRAAPAAISRTTPGPGAGERGVSYRTPHPAPRTRHTESAEQGRPCRREAVRPCQADHASAAIHRSTSRPAPVRPPAPGTSTRKTDSVHAPTRAPRCRPP